MRGVGPTPDGVRGVEEVSEVGPDGQKGQQWGELSQNLLGKREGAIMKD